MSKSNGTPIRNRNSWHLVPRKVLDKYEVSVGYVNTKKKIQPLMSSKPQARCPIEFGPPTNVELKEEYNSSEGVVKYFFTLSNENEQIKKLPSNIFDCYKVKIDKFTKKCTSLFVNSKEIFAMFLSLVNFSEGFIYHNEKYCPLGFNKDGTGMQKETIAANGGCLEDYKSLIKYAKESAVAIGSTSMEDASASSRKRCGGKENEHPKRGERTSAKLSKIEEKERKEITDENGIEQPYLESLSGAVQISIDNLSVHEDFEINQERVKLIRKEIVKRFDPSLATLVVCPQTNGESFEASAIHKIKFFVVQGVHKYLALKSLDERNLLTELFGCEERKVLCFILATSDQRLIHYGNLRGNMIASKFSKPQKPQQLFFIYESLKNKIGHAKALDSISRMVRLCRYSEKIHAAVLRILRWNEDGFNLFMDILDKMELFQTKDSNKSGKYLQRLANGEKNIMSDVQLIDLSNLTEDFLLKYGTQVLEGSLSLKELSVHFKKEKSVKKVYKTLSMMTPESQSFDEILDIYNEEFDSEKLIPFIGADIVNNQMNEKALMLKHYMDKVINSSAEDISSTIRFSSCSDVQILFNDIQSMLLKFDVLIYIMGKLGKQKNLSELIDMIFGNEKSFLAVIIVFSYESEYFEFLTTARNKLHSSNKGFEVIPLLFGSRTKDVSGRTEILENTYFVILFGKFQIRKKPIARYYEDLQDLNLVLDQICPQLTNVGLIINPGMPGVLVHDIESERRAEYFGLKEDISKLNWNYLAKKNLAQPNDLENREDSIKSPPDSFSQEIVESQSKSLLGDSGTSSGLDQSSCSLEEESKSLLDDSGMTSGLNQCPLKVSSNTNIDKESTPPCQYNYKEVLDRLVAESESDMFAESERDMFA